jgi:hypothetical protein
MAILIDTSILVRLANLPLPRGEAQDVWHEHSKAT